MSEKKEELVSKIGKSGGARRGWRTDLRALLLERRSVAMVEFAIVGPVFVFAAVALFEFGYLFTTQLVLDAWTQAVARQIQIGQAQQQGTQALFNSAVLCPGTSPNTTPSWLSCTRLLAYIVPVVPDYYNQAGFALPTSNGAVVPPNGAYGFCMAQPGQLMEVNMVYMAPVFLATVLPQTITYLGASAFALYSTAAFGTENYPVSGTLSSPC